MHELVRSRREAVVVWRAHVGMLVVERMSCMLLMEREWGWRLHLIEVDRSGMVLAMWALRKLGCGQDLIEWCSGQRVRGRSWPVVPVKNCKQWIMRWFMNGLRCLDGLGLRWKADAHTEQPLQLCGRVGMCRDLWKLVARAMTPA